MIKNVLIFTLKDVWKNGELNEQINFCINWIFIYCIRRIDRSLLDGQPCRGKTTENNAYPFEEKLKIAEELLSQSSKKVLRKHFYYSLNFLQKLFQNPLNSGQLLVMRGTPKNKDRLRALDIYKELNQLANLSKEERENLSYALGNLLLILNQEEEGKIHLNSAFQTSKDNKLRSKSSTFYR